MQPDIGTVCTDRRSDGLSTRTDDPNTLTHQSDGTHDAPRDPFYSPVICNPDPHGPIYVCVYGYVYIPVWHHNCREQLTLHLYIKSLPISASYLLLRSPSFASAVSHNSTVPTWFDSRFTMGSGSGYPSLNSDQVLWDLTQVLPIRFDPRFSTGFDSVLPTLFDSYLLTGLRLLHLPSRRSLGVKHAVTSFMRLFLLHFHNLHGRLSYLCRVTSAWCFSIARECAHTREFILTGNSPACGGVPLPGN